MTRSLPSVSKKRPPHVSMYRDRHGKIRWRFRKSGSTEAQTTLAFGEPDWWEWYFAALKGDVRQVGEERTIAGSFSALIVAYYDSSDWKSMKPATKASRRREVERFRSEHGEKRVRDLQARHIAKMMDLKADLPGAANNRLKALRALLSFAKTRGWRSDNPAMEVRKLRYRSEGFHTWSEDEIAKFEARWPIGTRERLAFDLLLYTGQRSADVRVMTAGQVQAGYISLRQSKTDGALEIPIHPALAASLAAREVDHLVLVTTKFGKPRSEKGFSNWISEAAKLAGIPGCSAHGLRKSAARRLAEAGCTVHEIMAITGHKSLKEVERYTRAVEQRASADAAMLKVQQTQREQKLSNRD